MREIAYLVSAATGVWMVYQGGAILTVIGLALLFMAGYNTGWAHALRTNGRT